MVHMHGPEFIGMLVAQHQQGMKQGHRIEPARKSQHQPRVRRNVAGKRVRHGGGDRPIWQGVP